MGTLQGVAIATLIITFLPFIVALTGAGLIWKFLCLLFCLLTLPFALAFNWFIALLAFLFWVTAWVFAGLARGRRSTERRLDRIVGSK